MKDSWHVYICTLYCKCDILGFFKKDENRWKRIKTTNSRLVGSLCASIQIYFKPYQLALLSNPAHSSSFVPCHGVNISPPFLTSTWSRWMRSLIQGLKNHQYANDTQLYNWVSKCAGNPSDALSQYLEAVGGPGWGTTGFDWTLAEPSQARLDGFGCVELQDLGL